MENHEPYFDDEDESGDDWGSPQFADVPASPDLEPMSIATDGDYKRTEENRVQRKACFAAVLSVCFLVMGYWITLVHDFSSTHPSAYSHGSSRGKQSFSDCSAEGLDADYYAKLMDRVQHWNQTQLCTTEFKIHDCKCCNPFVPKASDAHRNWNDVSTMNTDLVKHNYTDKGFQPEVVIYGDSITEHMIGRHFGHNLDMFYQHAKVTQEMLTKRGGGRINGLPLGIAADQMANLLYRLQNGEMPEELQPRVWWLLIGTNDIGTGCSADTVVAGNIRLVKEIREQYNDQYGHKTLTPVVINSILPRGKSELHSDQSAYHRTMHRVNRQLDCYAQLTPGVYFVNATSTMTETMANGTYLKQGYFEGDNLHPSAEGQRQWEALIVSNVMQLMT